MDTSAPGAKGWAWTQYRPFFARRLEAAQPDVLERPPAEEAIAT